MKPQGPINKISAKDKFTLSESSVGLGHEEGSKGRTEVVPLSTRSLAILYIPQYTQHSSHQGSMSPLLSLGCLVNCSWPIEQEGGDTANVGSSVFGTRKLLLQPSWSSEPFPEVKRPHQPMDNKWEDRYSSHLEEPAGATHM